jgi:hypothetical protein
LHKQDDDIRQRTRQDEGADSREGSVDHLHM